MPDSTPLPPRKPITIERLKSVIGKDLLDFITNPLKPVSRVALNRLSENIEPWNYNDVSNSIGNKSSFQRAIDAIVLNKKEPSRAEKEQYLQKGYGAVANEEDKLRLDLLQMYAGKQPKYGTVTESQYKPTVGAEKGQKYYDSPVAKESVINQFVSGKIGSFSNLDELKQKLQGSIAATGSNLSYSGKGGKGAIVAGLGASTVGAGKDDKGYYISYSDLWDLDPNAGMYSDKTKSGIFSVEGLQDLAKQAGKFILEREATPPSIYGRIYIDPKTGEPLKDQPKSAPQKTPQSSERLKQVLNKK